MIDQTETSVENKSTVTTMEQTNEVVTQVTSIAQEDLKNNTQTKLPSPEELVAKASVSLMQKRQLLNNIVGNLSKKATLRVLAAGLDLPAEGLPILLKTEQEKMGYMLLQQIQRDRFIILQDAIGKEMKRIKQEREINQQQGESNV